MPSAPIPRQTGAEMIATERERQITQEGYGPGHDDLHENRDLAHAGAAYALHAGTGKPGMWGRGTPGRDDNPYSPSDWPWEVWWWKPSTDPVRDLVKAGALIAAEIDRLQRDSGSL